MASEMFLYWGSGSPPCWSAMLALEEKGLSGYPNKLVSFEKGEHKSEEVLKWNPRGQVSLYSYYHTVIHFQNSDYVGHNDDSICVTLKYCDRKGIWPVKSLASNLQRFFFDRPGDWPVFLEITPR